MTKESEARLTEDGLSRNLGGEYAQEHGYGDAETYSDGSPKHLPDTPLRAHEEAADEQAERDAQRAPETVQDLDEGRAEQLEKEAFGERGSDDEPARYTQAPG